ncbi:unnamed protein product [Menidia menidia]|uniref:(Atlantic silverside) hypothetical protein n=1 Tax=Menidia menidia TaxID=238744 RepID=A0A8S4AL53_9TELE|nr:unnamed protein product [Menidia menidia]
MSTSGTLTSYYVDSLILPETEELPVPRYPSGSGLQHARHQPASSISDHGELGTCTFPSKAPVFGPSWNHVPAQFPGAVSSVYHHAHHYGHPQGPVAADPDGRYQSWLLEPVSGSLPMSGLPTTHHPYGIKPEALATRADGALAGSHTALLLSDYANGTVATASPGEKDELTVQAGDAGGEGDEKPGLDPSKSQPTPSSPPPFVFELFYTHKAVKNDVQDGEEGGCVPPNAILNVPFPCGGC